MSDTMLEWLTEEDRTAKQGVIGILCQVMGQSPYDVYEWDDWFGVEKVQAYCERKGIHWGKLLQHDVERVCSGLMPEFFLEHWIWADLYRANHSISYEKPQGGIVYGWQTIGNTEDFIADAQNRYLDAPRHLGWACPKEQAYFYQTEEWKRCAAAYRYHDGYECCICRTRHAGTLHVHHRMPIISAYHHNFHLNFSWWKLESLCESCHHTTHNRTVRGIFHMGYDYVTPEEVKAEKPWLKQAYAKHHADGACGWCKEHGE